MNVNQIRQPAATGQAAAPLENIIRLDLPKQRSKQATVAKPRFRIIGFRNRAGSQSWRVTGTKRDGARMRENYCDLQSAECRQLELEAEYQAREQPDSTLRSTRLTDTQVRIAEVALGRLDRDEELLQAVDYWLRQGRKAAVFESPRLDDAVQQFQTWLEGTPALRERTKDNLRLRIGIFANSVPNHRVADFTPEEVETFLAKRAVSPASRDNDRRAVSRFFGWCMERPRRWATANPCHGVRVEQGEKPPPAILSLDECKRLMSLVQRYKDGRLAPYCAVCLFGGLRPEEAKRLTWSQVNLADGELRLEAHQTKTGRGRVFRIVPTVRGKQEGPKTLLEWLKAYEGKDFFPANWRKDFDEIKRQLGYGAPTEDNPNLRPWPDDVLRHTAISHYFRLTGSYGETAEAFGNSEAIIKRHYQGRVSSRETQAFYEILP